MEAETDFPTPTGGQRGPLNGGRWGVWGCVRNSQGVGRCSLGFGLRCLVLAAAAAAAGVECGCGCDRDCARCAGRGETSACLNIQLQLSSRSTWLAAVAVRGRDSGFARATMSTTQVGAVTRVSSLHFVLPSGSGPQQAKAGSGSSSQVRQTQPKRRGADKKVGGREMS